MFMNIVILEPAGKYIHLFKQIDTEDVLYIKMCVWGSLGVMLVRDFSLNCCCFYMAYKLSKVIS